MDAAIVIANAVKANGVKVLESLALWRMERPSGKAEKAVAVRKASETGISVAGMLNRNSESPEMGRYRTTTPLNPRLEAIAINVAEENMAEVRPTDARS